MSRTRAVAHTDWPAFEGVWRDLEAQGGALPYQRFDFVAPWFRHVSARRNMTPVLVEIGIAGRTAMLIPLDVTTHGLARIARLPGGRQMNLGGPIVDPALAPLIDPGRLGDCLVELGAGPLGIDGYAFLNQPDLPQGACNPLVEMSESRPSTAVSFRLDLDAPAEAVLARVLSHGTRRNVAKKRKSLAEHGTVRFGPAADRAEAEMLLATFLRQKSERFAAQGLANPFDDDGVAAFLRSAVLEAAPGALPGLEIFGLWCGERPVAVFGAASTAERMSGSFICFDPDPNIARCSPGELALVDIIRLAGERGVRVFDLGLGRGPLKARFCKAPQPMVDTMLPVTQLGGAALLALRTAGRLKDLIQRDDRIAGPARRLAGWLGLQPRD